MSEKESISSDAKPTEIPSQPADSAEQAKQVAGQIGNVYMYLSSWKVDGNKNSMRVHNQMLDMLSVAQNFMIKEFKLDPKTIP